MSPALTPMARPSVAIRNRLLVAARRSRTVLTSAPIIRKAWRILPRGWQSAVKRWIGADSVTQELGTPLPSAPGSAGTFCVYPFLHLDIGATGDVRVCCKASEHVRNDGVAMNVHQHSLDEIWNSDAMRSLRQDMIEGKPVAACSECYEEENAGALSMRLKGLRGWQNSAWLNEERMTLDALKAKVIADDYRLSTPPVHYQMEVGNVCNLKCRMCSSDSSSFIAEDAVHNAWTADRQETYHNRDLPIVARPRSARITSNHRDFVAKELVSSSSRIKQLYFVGGETLLAKDVAATLQCFVDSGAAPDIELVLQSNGSLANASALKVAHQFKRLVLGISVDGFGQYYEYIRYPAKWKKLAANLDTFKTLPNTALKANIVFQIYNALNIVELFTYLDAVDIAFDVTPLLFPNYLRPSAMPPRARALAAERLRAYAERCLPARRQLINGLATAVAPTTDGFDRRLMHDFMLFTNDLDATRGQSFENTHAELLELIADTGFRWTDETLHAKSIDRAMSVAHV